MGGKVWGVLVGIVLVGFERVGIVGGFDTVGTVGFESPGAAGFGIGGISRVGAGGASGAGGAGRTGLLFTEYLRAGCTGRVGSLFVFAGSLGVGGPAGGFDAFKKLAWLIGGNTTEVLLAGKTEELVVDEEGEAIDCVGKFPIPLITVSGC